MRRKRRFEGGEWDLADVNEQELAKDTDGAPFPTRLEKQGRDCAEGESLPFECSKEDNEDNKEKQDLGSSPPVIKKEALPPANTDFCEERRGERKRAAERELGKEKSRTGEKKKRKSGAPYVAVTLLCFFLCIGIVAAAFWNSRGAQTERIENAADTDAPKKDLTAEGQTPSASGVYEQGARSAVTVVSSKGEKEEYWSGTAIFEGGYVATLCDAVANSQSVSVIGPDGTEHEAVVVGVQEEVNLALLYCEAQITPVSVGKSESISAGSDVFAIGSLDEGRYASSLLATRVAYAERMTLVEDGGGIEKMWSVIQLGRLGDRSLLGCPVFDFEGKAIGILAFCQSDEEVSLAIPLDRALAVLSALKDGGEIEKGDIAAIAYTPARLGILGENGESGVRVADFFEGDTDASKMLRTGDVIYMIGDVETPDIQSIQAVIATRQSGEKVEVFVRRGGQKLSFWVALA